MKKAIPTHFEHLLNTAAPDVNGEDFVDLSWIFKTFSEEDLVGVREFSGSLVMAASASFSRGKTCAADHIVSEMLDYLDEECFEILRFRAPLGLPGALCHLNGPVPRRAVFGASRPREPRMVAVGRC